MNFFTLIPANTSIWNFDNFLQFIIDNQGRAVDIYTNNEGVCLESVGVYRLLDQFRYKNVTIHTSNLLEQHPIYQIKLIAPFKFFKIEHANYTHLHTWNKDKIFACFYNRPLWYRIGLGATLQHDYKHCSLINIRTQVDSVDQRALVETEQLFIHHPESFVKFLQEYKTWPITIEPVDGYTVGNCTTGHTDQLAEFYLNFLIDIVAETWTTGRTFFATEKTVRPMMLKKPFILMGSKNYLDYLHQMGFKTFNDFWNEDYDGYEGKERYVKILELIDVLAQKSTDELEHMYWDMQYILDHNYNLLLTKTYNKIITEII
jgi:hypothetical protein